MTFREILIEFDTRRNETMDSANLSYRVVHQVDTIEWAVESILERLANWEESRDDGAPQSQPE